MNIQQFIRALTIDEKETLLSALLSDRYPGKELTIRGITVREFMAANPLMPIRLRKALELLGMQTPIETLTIARILSVRGFGDTTLRMFQQLLEKNNIPKLR